jgi:hypothetical protein
MDLHHLAILLLSARNRAWGGRPIGFMSRSRHCANRSAIWKMSSDSSCLLGIREGFSLPKLAGPFFLEGPSACGR